MGEKADGDYISCVISPGSDAVRPEDDRSRDGEHSGNALPTEKMRCFIDSEDGTIDVCPPPAPFRGTFWDEDDAGKQAYLRHDIS